MKKLILALIIITASCLSGQSIKSPSGTLTLTFFMTPSGQPGYYLTRGEQPVTGKSVLGVLFNNGPGFHTGLKLVSADTSTHYEEWNPVWGEVKTIVNHYRELRVKLEQTKENPAHCFITFRVFDDGIGFRYEFPVQDHLQYFTVKDELTTFNLSGNHKAFWIPGDFDSNEYPYKTSRLSDIDASGGSDFFEISTKSIVGRNVVQTPLMLKTEEGLYINIFEAALKDYPAMNVSVNKDNYELRAVPVPDAVGNKAYLQTPCSTPWRTIIVSDKAEEILSSKLILNLNEPSVIKETDWIKPQKYIGIWWEMHVGKASWNYSDVRNVKLAGFDWSKVQPNGKHGATTERTKYYIDFAAKHGFEGVLVEGWNVGWEDWFGNWKEDVFDFVTPYPDFNVKELSEYAKAKGVKLIMHHETSASATNYERWIDSAFRFMNYYGYDAVKTGYVGRIIPRGEHHDGQWMVRHYVRVAEKAAAHKIMLNAHEPVRPTGLHRTYPNWLACEAARGNEFNAWSRGNPPEHETILPFTRLMGGPMDYTPGIFQIKMNYYNPDSRFQVHTTLAKQLALYITMYSPLQMAADIPENYDRFPDAFQFIKDVAVDWDDTKILAAEPGDYIVIARKTKGKDEWFIGAITDENSREMTVDLSFLGKDGHYNAEIYKDGEDASWDDNPMSYKVEKAVYKTGDKITFRMAKGGGAAVRLSR